MPAEAMRPVVLDASWVPQALLLSQEAGWNQTAADWTVFFTHGTVLGFVVDGRLVATTAALPYGHAFGWISMVLVTADWRGQGLATRLVAAGTSVLRDTGRAALLDAVPAATRIYTALGFVTLGAVERWEGHGGGVTATSAAADLALDQVAFGADRRFLLEDLLSRPDSLGFQSPHGFAILRRGSVAWHLGPMVCKPAEATALVTEAVRAAPGRVLVDVLDGATLIPALTAHGFRQQRRFLRMAMGLSALPGDPTQMLAAAGPEFG